MTTKRKPTRSAAYRAALRRFNLLRALAVRGITEAEAAEMDALAAELDAVEMQDEAGTETKP